MDSLRGEYKELHHPLAGHHAPEDEDTGREPLPMAIGHAERRLQVRAYNFWAALLGERRFPASDALDLQRLADFAGYCVLLDVSDDREAPRLGHVGMALAQECGVAEALTHLSEAPQGSLLSCITDHYRQVFASDAPVGFEAEFVNWRGATILYRGILLPFSRDDAEIDHVLCVINWKEVLDARVVNALQREIAESYEPLRRLRLEPEGLADWANGPDAGAEAQPLRDLHEGLRALPEVPLASLPAQGEEFTVLLARRGPDGQVIVLGEVPHKSTLVERAARGLIGA
ncbi:hypothetical protein [Novosphingobium sp. 9U]|uniref:hypothetical protein n=1 Tax=Novosphingobium sp. 9U TaxID=2653158 RepID=UPI0012EF5F24|nr:hypothetical protein [Novosphingobium sp. 9U]VWX53675.1 hypothetical protein NOVOSPHI9U_50306 [Novosphingobium sp. 9U]